MGRTRRPSYLVASPDGLAKLLEDVIQKHHDGTVSAAARDFNAQLQERKADAERRRRTKSSAAIPKPIERSELQRLRRSQLRRIHANTAEWLAAFVAPLPGGSRRLRAAVFSPEDQARMVRYRAWGQARVGRDRPPSEDLIAKWDLLTDLIQEIKKDIGLRSYLAPLEKAANRRHVEPWRLDLAVFRAFEPLLDAGETGGVERSWQELSRRERERYLTCAVGREALLLDRDSDFNRAQNSSASPLTDGERKWLAEFRAWRHEVGWEPDDDRA